MSRSEFERDFYEGLRDFYGECDSTYEHSFMKFENFDRSNKKNKYEYLDYDFDFDYEFEEED